MAATLNHRKALLILNGLQHVGPIMLRRLLDAYDHDPVAVLSGDRKKLLSVKGVGEKAARVLVHWSDHFDLSKEIERMKASNIRFIAQTDDAFPPMLQEMYDPVSYTHLRAHET